MTNPSERELAADIDKLGSPEPDAPIELVVRIAETTDRTLIESWDHVAGRGDIGDPQPLADFTDIDT